MENTTGTVKWFDSKRGYGFITTDSGAEVFVHYSAIQASGYKTLKEGQAVELTVVKDNKGMHAEDVTPV
jgi:CspA family cold shock protein